MWTACCRGNNVEVVEELIRAGLNVDEEDEVNSDFFIFFFDDDL